MFARARTWGFLEAGSATFGETVTLSVNGESITVDDFSYMRLANAINDVRGTSGVGAYAEDWGLSAQPASSSGRKLWRNHIYIHRAPRQPKAVGC